MKWVLGLITTITLALGFSTSSAQADVSAADNAIMASDYSYTLIADDTATSPLAGENVYDSYASLPDRIQPQGERTFIFNPRALRWGAYDADGYLVASGKANGGSDFCAELGRPCHTPVGVFRVQSKGSEACISKRFPLATHGGAPMPYCMHFGGGFAIHGSPYISNNNTSHGCIRVYTPAAAWLSRYFMSSGTKVMVLPYN